MILRCLIDCVLYGIYTNQFLFCYYAKQVLICRQVQAGKTFPNCFLISRASKQTLPLHDLVNSLLFVYCKITQLTNLLLQYIRLRIIGYMYTISPNCDKFVSSKPPKHNGRLCLCNNTTYQSFKTSINVRNWKKIVITANMQQIFSRS